MKLVFFAIALTTVFLGLNLITVQAMWPGASSMRLNSISWQGFTVCRMMFTQMYAGHFFTNSLLAKHL